METLNSSLSSNFCGTNLKPEQPWQVKSMRLVKAQARAVLAEIKKQSWECHVDADFSTNFRGVGA